jgi:hypothetical protein
MSVAPFSPHERESLVLYPPGVQNNAARKLAHCCRALVDYGAELQRLEQRLGAPPESETPLAVQPPAAQTPYAALDVAGSRTGRRSTMTYIEHLERATESVCIFEPDAIASQDKKIGLMRPATNAATYDLEFIAGRFVFGEGFKFHTRLFWGFVSLFSISAVPWVLSYCRIMPRTYLIPAEILCLPCIIYLYLVMNVPIIKVAVRQPHVLLINFWITVCFVCSTAMIVATGDDTGGMILGGVSFCLACTLVSFTDALPPGVRQVMTHIMYPAMLCIVLFLQVALSYNWMEWQDVQISFLGHFNGVTRSIQATAMMNISVLLFTNIITSFLNPNHLTNVRSSVEAITLSLEDARLVKALHAVQAKYHGRPLGLVDALRDLLGFSTHEEQESLVLYPPGVQDDEGMRTHCRRALVEYGAELQQLDRRGLPPENETALAVRPSETQSSEAELIVAGSRVGRRSTMAYIAHLERATESVSVLAPDAIAGGGTKIGLMRPSTNAATYELEFLAGRLVFGEGFKFQKRYFWGFMSMFSVSAVPWLLSYCRIVSRAYLIPAEILCLPCILYLYLIMNVPILKIVVRQPQVLLINFWITVGFLCKTAMIIVTGDDTCGMILAGASFCLGVGMVSFTDALPPSVRQVIAKIIYPAVLCIVIFLHVALSYNWMEWQDIQLSHLGYLNYSAGAVVATAYMNISVLIFTSIVTSFLNPNHLTNVRSSVEAITLSLEEARLVKALHAVQAKYLGRPLSLVDALRDLAGFADPAPESRSLPQAAHSV